MKLAIYGAGGLGREVMYYAQESGRWDDYFFVVDRRYMPENEKVNGRRIFAVEDIKSIFSADNVEFLVCSGEPQYRKAMYNYLTGESFSMATFVDPSVVVPPNAAVDEGAIILKGSILSTNTRIKRNALLSFGVIVGHDAEIGEHCNLSPGVMMGGFTRWGKCSFGGIGCNIRDHVIIGENAVVGQGAVVLKSVGEGVTVVGNPAKKLDRGGQTTIF